MSVLSRTCPVDLYDTRWNMLKRVWTEAHGTCVNASRHNQKQVPQSAIRQVSQESSGRQSGQVAHHASEPHLWRLGFRVVPLPLKPRRIPAASIDHDEGHGKSVLSKSIHNKTKQHKDSLKIRQHNLQHADNHASILAGACAVAAPHLKWCRMWHSPSQVHTSPAAFCTQQS